MLTILDIEFDQILKILKKKKGGGGGNVNIFLGYHLIKMTKNY